MNFNHKILSHIYYPYKAIKNIATLFVPNNDKILRVLLFHDIAKKDFDKFKEKLEWLSKEWKFISANDFEKMINGDKQIIGNNLLLTFDDGFLSDYFVAKEILTPMGIPALYFIISEFVKMKDKKDQVNFLKKNLYPKWKGERIPIHRKELINMSYDNIKYLIQSGHEIGYHTASHQRLSTIVSKKVLKNEIIAGADELELILNIKINHFSFSFGDLESFNEQALKLAKSRYKFIYTGMRGNNAKHLNPLALRRDTIAVNDSNNLAGSFLLGAADFIYEKKFNIYESWVT